MIHTAVWTPLIPTFVLGLSVAVPAQDGSSKSAQHGEVKKVIASLQKREGALKSLRLRMTTRGSYPSGLEFATHGSLRVLGTTHFHIDVQSGFGKVRDDVQSVRREDWKVWSAVEKVITPAGVQTRQSGPAEHVYTTMDKELMLRLRHAMGELAKEKDAPMGVPGPLADGGKAALGSAMLSALNQQFDLVIQTATEKVDGVEYRLVRGKWRGLLGVELPPDVVPEDPRVDPRGVHRVEIRLRPHDDVPVLMKQFNFKGEVTLSVSIDELEIDVAMAEASFKLEIPKGHEWKDVMEHLTSRAQIKRALDDFEALKSERAARKKEGGKDKPK